MNRFIPVFVALAGFAVAAPVHAQNALGDGKALDRNLGTNTNGRNARRTSIVSEVELRNALLTGNVAGGRQFRGETGYTAPRDFRGETGSDDFFTFQADSFYSGLATQNLRGLGGVRNTFGRATLGQIGSSTGDRKSVV